MNDRFGEIQNGISERQSELQGVTNILAAKAQKIVKISAAAKVIIILLGAIVATRETANLWAGENNLPVSIIYTVLGVTIAVVAGLEAAFKWERRAAELRILAATCQSTVRQVDSQWQKEVGPAAGAEREAAAIKLMELQDDKLTEVQSKAAELGVNITLEIREIQGEREVYQA